MSLQPSYPPNVSAIPVRQFCRRLHFLHGLGWAEAEETPVARYVVHFADGESTTLDVIYGRDVRNWQFSPEIEAAEQGGAEPAWKGPQARWKEHYPKWGVRLYTLSWTNPRPEVEIRSLDLVSTLTKSAPFVIAITTDPLDAQ